MTQLLSGTPMPICTAMVQLWGHARCLELIIEKLRRHFDAATGRAPFLLFLLLLLLLLVVVVVVVVVVLLLPLLLLLLLLFVARAKRFARRIGVGGTCVHTTKTPAKKIPCCLKKMSFLPQFESCHSQKHGVCHISCKFSEFPFPELQNN